MGCDGTKKQITSYLKAIELIAKLKPGEAIEFCDEQTWGLTQFARRQLGKKAIKAYTVYPDHERGRVTVTRKPKPRVVKIARKKRQQT